jgi:hypothetical protein
LKWSEFYQMGSTLPRIRVFVYPARMAGVALSLLLLGRSLAVGQAVTEVRDSAGVLIVENSVAAGHEVAEWRLSRATVVAIGVIAGDARYQLYRVSSAFRLKADQIVIANAGTDELRFYETSGRFVRGVGGRGDGPGEFRELGSVMRFGEDSLVAWDSRLGRLSFFDNRGNFGRSVNLAEEAGITSYSSVGVSDDGRVLLHARKLYGLPEGLHRDSVVYVLVSPEGEMVDTVGYFPDEETYVHRMGQGYSGMLAPFGRSTQTALWHDRLFVGTQDSYEIRVHSMDGDLRSLIRVSRPLTRVTTDDIARYQDEKLDNASTARWRRELEKIFRSVEFPTTMPAYAGIVVDADGNLWVQDYLSPRGVSVRWSVFDGAGRLAATVNMPERFTPLDIGPDYVLGCWTDPMGVEFVKLYGLQRH